MSKEESVKIDKSVIITKSLEEIMHESMLPYAEYVILDRAIPRVEDGLKPVQRRILYTMKDLGLTPEKPYKKSARTVGECLGKYHPHGDTSVYDAMVRMAQPFNMRMLLVDGHGNFGTVDGDGAAAMRYTETRLNPLAMELLRDLDKDTVKWNLNFDDTVKEPDTLPGRFPNLLVNGCMGIAVGLATNIPPHNLTEVIDGVIAYINSPRIPLKQMMKIIKGPDFPTGGYVVGGDELVKAYETGKGKLILRAKVHIEGEEKRNIVITEIPYQVNKAKLLQKILALRESDKDNFGCISEITDESDRTGMRAVIRLKKGSNAINVLNKLYVKTELQCNFGVNIVAIADGKPQQLGLIDIIKYYVDYQREIIVRRTKFDLAKAKDRAHIVEGLLIAVKNIDKVIKIIKTSSSVTVAKQRLRETFVLSEKQAQAILDMRLARLTNLEVNRLEEEYKELMDLIKKLTEILESKKLQMQVIKDELKDIRKRFKDPRRSVMVDDIKDITIQSDTDEQPVRDYCIAVSSDDYIKKVPMKSYALATREIGSTSTLNQVIPILFQTQDNHMLYAFTNLGNCYKIKMSALPEVKWRDKGVKLQDVVKNIPTTEKIVKIYPILEDMPDKDLLFMTRQGMVKRTNMKELGLMKSAYQVMKLKDDDEIISITRFDKEKTLLFVTKGGMVLNAETTDIPLQGRVAGGVKGINLASDDEVIYSYQVNDEGEVAMLTDKGYGKRVLLCKIEPMARYRKGVKLIDLKPSENGSQLIFAGYVTHPYYIVGLTKKEEIIYTFTNELNIENRTTKGKCISNRRKSIPLLSATRHKTEGEIMVQHKEKKK